MDHTSSTASDLRVLIVGAGITGLLVAQGLKKHGIPAFVFEAEKSAQDYRPTDWGMGIHWSVPLLEACLPEHLFSNIRMAQVDPFFEPPDFDDIPMYNGQTGELLKRLPLPKVHRVSRRKMRALCAEGITVQYDKKLVSIEAEADNQFVTAIFEDGSEVTGNVLIGADGARSLVRRHLLGDKGEAETAPYLATRIPVKYKDAIQARMIRADSHPINALAIHPSGIFGWISMLDVEDPDDPTTWTFQLMTSWPSNDAGPSSITIKDIQTKMAVFAHPFSTANAWIPETADTKVTVNHISNWKPIPFDNQNGRITLVGDSAHPMTFHRGQGLNHGIADAEALVRTLVEVSNELDHLPSLISAYDETVRERGGNEVVLSRINSAMLHDWGRLMDSPLMKMSANRA